MAGVTERERTRFLEALGHPELATHPCFVSAGAMLADRAATFAVLEPIFRERTTAVWTERLSAANQRFAPVNDYRAVAEYEQAYENGYLRRVDHPNWGAISEIGSPVDLSLTPAAPGITAPELGQHTEEVLIEAGYTWDDIGRLRDAGVI
jgi:formyl-CoA transferase